jgi:hypothetical protein
VGVCMHACTWSDSMESIGCLQLHSYVAHTHTNTHTAPGSVHVRASALTCCYRSWHIRLRAHAPQMSKRHIALCRARHAAPQARSTQSSPPVLHDSLEAADSSWEQSSPSIHVMQQAAQWGFSIKDADMHSRQGKQPGGARQTQAPNASQSGHRHACTGAQQPSSRRSHVMHP